MSVQVPAVSTVSEVPLTVQTLSVVLVKVTARPELLIALTVRGVAETVNCDGTLYEVMFCGIPAIVLFTVRGEAAA